MIKSVIQMGKCLLEQHDYEDLWRNKVVKRFKTYELSSRYTYGGSEHTYSEPKEVMEDVQEKYCKQCGFIKRRYL